MVQSANAPTDLPNMIGTQRNDAPAPHAKIKYISCAIA